MRTITLVYGVVDDNLVFIPEDEAEELAVVHRALSRSKTWGDFKSAIPTYTWSEVIRFMDRLSFDEFYSGEQKRRPNLTMDQARQEYASLDTGDRYPLDGDPFNAESVPGYMNGDFPGWPQQAMLDFLPKDIIAKFGKLEDSFLNGQCLTLSAGSAKQIVAALEKHGFVCERNTKLVNRASGYAE